MKVDARTRLARLLLRLAEEHGCRSGQSLTTGLPLTHEEVATLMGTSRQTVSLHLAELTKAGLVARRGRLLLLPNPPGGGWRPIAGVRVTTHRRDSARRCRRNKRAR